MDSSLSPILFPWETSFSQLLSHQDSSGLLEADRFALCVRGPSS